MLIIVRETTGRIMCSATSPNDCQPFMATPTDCIPSSGSQPRSTAKIFCSRSARKKEGSEMPAKATTVKITSNTEWTFVAERTPTGIAMASSTTNEIIASRKEFQMKAWITSDTG